MTLTPENLIRDSGRLIREHLIYSAAGIAPAGVRAWRALCESHELYSSAITACPPSFTAHLWYDEDHHLWLTGYNFRASEPQVCRYLCHELAEYITLQDYAHLFDDIPGLRPAANASSMVYHYTGAGNPDDLRHLIACEVERLVFGD